jgi:NADP-dependent 3-hydroxy acid dehydrogenase YdfG
MVADEISRSGGKALAHTMDMTDAADVEAMVRAARDAFGPVEVTSTEALHQ